MKVLVTMCILTISLTAAVNKNCNYHKLLDELHKKKINLGEYTRIYTECISSQSKTGKVSGPQNVPVQSAPVSQSQPAIVQSSVNGFQPSCSIDTPVEQAVAKFNNQGLFIGADKQQHPFSVEGVVSFTQIDSQTTRIKAVIRGVNSFAFDSKLFSLHVHQKGETNPTCTSTGGHYDPCQRDHSNNPLVENREVGDVARVSIPQGSDILTIETLDTQVKLSGPLSVLGRSVTVHGGSGSTRVGCGTIAVTEWEGKDHPDLMALLNNL